MEFYSRSEMRLFIPLQRRWDSGVSGILFLKMLSPAIVGKISFLRETRPRCAGGGRGEFSPHALDDRHEGGPAAAGSGAPWGVRRVVPAPSVSTLHFRPAPRAFTDAALLREEVGRTDPAEIDEEIHVFATLWFACEGRLGHENEGQTRLFELRKRIFRSSGVLSGVHATQGAR